jgi:hypothetical protein
MSSAVLSIKLMRQDAQYLSIDENKTSNLMLHDIAKVRHHERHRIRRHIPSVIYNRHLKNRQVRARRRSYDRDEKLYLLRSAAKASREKAVEALALEERYLLLSFVAS